MADTSLGRASLSVTADLSGFVSSLDAAAAKSASLGDTFTASAAEANKVTNSTEKIVQSLEQLQQAAVAGSINSSLFKQNAAAAKLAVDQMVLLDGATLLLMKDENELQFQQAKLTTAYKELETNLMHTDAAFKNNALLIELNTQKQKNLAMESKLTIAKMLAMDDAAIGLAANQKSMSAEMDIANRKLQLQTRQMMLETGATKALHDELIKLEEQEKAMALAEDKVKGINQPVPIVEPPKIDTNTPQYVQEQMNLRSETDLATKAMELQARQMNVESGATKKLHDEMKRLEEQEKKIIELENKARGINQPVPIVEPPKIDTNTPQYVQEQMNLRSETDLATKAMELQARQMNVESGATKKLHDEMKRLEEQEKKIIELENKARGIPPPLPIKPPPIPVDKNTAAFVLNAKKMASETDLLNRKLDIQARQMMIDSGAAAKLAQELSALEKAEKKLAAEEAKINAASGRGQPKDIQKTTTNTVNAGMKITDMLGIGFFTSAFTKLFDGAISLVKSLVGSVMDLGTKVIESGSKFQELDNRLKALTSFNGLAKGLQTIMKAGPSASFMALGEAATRLSALQFNPEALQGLIGKFNSLGVALGNPERILNLIVDKIGDMASEGSATMGALGKLAEEGIPVFEALANRMGVSVEEAKRRVKDGLVSVTEGTQAIADAAGMPGMIAAAQQSANSFAGIWARATNNIEVLFQTVGSKILKGFGLVEMGDTITNFFDNIFVKVEELTPVFEKIGAFAASVTQLILDELAQLMFGWKAFSDDTSAENMMESMKGFAEQLVAVLRDLVNQLIETGKSAKNAADNISWWTNINLTNNPVANFFTDILVAGGEFFLNVGEWSDGIETIGNGANSAANQLGKLNDEMQNTLHWSAQLPKDTFFSSGSGGSFQSDIEAMTEELKAFDEQWNELANAKPLMLELPKWQKFLEENKTPLQIYESELERLNLMLDGTEQGFQAFAIGSANALKKLKEATGLGEVKFAAAITAGSAEDFKATLDAQNQNVDVQQQIREIMAQAAVIQQAQLNAQIQIAQGIQNLRPPKPVNVMAN